MSMYKRALKNTIKQQAQDSTRMDRLAEKLLRTNSAASIAFQKLRKEGYNKEEILQEWQRIGVRQDILTYINNKY